MNTKKTALLITLSLLLSSCGIVSRAPAPPDDGKMAMSKSTKGMIVGGLVGGAGGALVDSGRGTVIGAAAGLVAGGLTGHYLDKQSQAIHTEHSARGVKYVDNGQTADLILPSELVFEKNGANLNADDQAMLNDVASIMKKHPDMFLEIRGYANDKATESQNKRLSQERASHVAQYLEEHGVPYSRLNTKGYGIHHPSKRNRTNDQDSANQYVDLKLIVMPS